MWLTLDDLQCSECGGFVHPLLEACPTCGAPRMSRRQEAAAGPIGAERLAEAPETLRLARNLSIRYTMKVNAIHSPATGDATLVDAVAYLADALTYRIAGDAFPTTDNAALTLRDGSLIAQGRPSGVLLAEIPLPAIVGSAARRGEVTVHYVASLTTGPASDPAGSPSAMGLRHLTAANRRGLLAAKARDDHFDALARWLGLVAAAAAERRWTEVGLPAYVAELGPAAGDLAAGDPAGSAVAAAGSADSPSPIQASLVQLESLRAAGLVADEEYAEKRREILARL